MSIEAFSQRLESMKEVLPDQDYYTITLLVDESGQIKSSVYTKWVGFTDEKPMREIRAPSIVCAQRMVEFWESTKQPYLVVNELDDLVIYFMVGGAALVEKEVAQKGAAEFFQTKRCALSGPMGYRFLDEDDRSAVHRAPTPKQRMRIFKRDHHRCRVCGRSPDDYVDVELHLHHIRPWAKGGLTEDCNLITLCHTCHKGLDPHEDLSLFSRLEVDKLDEHALHTIKGMIRYREKFPEIVELLENIETGEAS